MNRQRLFLLLAIAMLLAGSSVVYYQNQTAPSNHQNAQNVAANQIGENEAAGNAVFVNQAVRPPLENVTIPFTVHRIQPNKPQTIKLPSGSSIVIPADAFVDAAGNPVKELVEIHYREFHDAADLITSGIPMRVKGKNGEENWMQTAGMFEMRGLVNEKPVFIAEGKSVEVNMASAVNGEYPFWYYNENSNNWEQLGSVEAQANPNETSNNTLTRTVQPLPFKPVAYNKELALNLQLDYSSFPAFQGHEKTIWQYVGADASKKPSENKWIQTEAWTDVQLDKTQEDNQYILTLTSDTAVYAVRVSPALRGADYETAMANYRAKLENYQATIQASKVQEEARQYLRSFSVSGFGIFNYDVIYGSKDRIPIYADFQIKGNSEAFEQFQKSAVVFLITADKRTVVSYNFTNWDKFSINPYDQNQLVVLLPNNRYAKMSTTAFQEQRDNIKAAAGRKYTFWLELEETAIASLDDLQMVL